MNVSRRIRVWPGCLALAVCLVALAAPPAKAQAPSDTTAITDSPRQTMEALVAGAARLDSALATYGRERTPAAYRNVLSALDTLGHLFDLSEVPIALRAYAGPEVAAQTLDVLSRTELVDVVALPGPDDVALDQPYLFRVPGTPLRLWRVEEGTRRGEVLFDPFTVATVARDAQSGRQELRETRRWSNTVTALTGPLVPLRLADAMPEAARIHVMGTPLWKALCGIALVGLAALALWIGQRIVRRWVVRHEMQGRWASMLTPLGLAAVSVTLTDYLTFELRVSGSLSAAIHSANTMMLHIAAAWLLWLLVRAAFDRAAARFDGRPESLDVNMLHLLGQIIAALAAIVALLSGAQALGLPVLSIVAGFGIGGLAIALAIRPTLENLIGGFILYLDRPIRVGDFCTFGGLAGSVERIGVRSTQIRALDRTVINVPNAQFADLQLINWAECDMMMISELIGLRYETGMDTLRYVLAEIRRMMHAHPRIDNDSIRVRFVGYGAHSLNIEIRVYAVTREWNDFFAIKEDVLFRVGEIVDQSGTGFAFPSQTLYLTQDGGLDADALARSQAETSTWRRERRFPFPRFSGEELERIDNTLRYPPPGSPEYLGEDEPSPDSSEMLSAAPAEDSPLNKSQAR